MRPVNLRLKGFTSFKDGVEISFRDFDRFAICGPTGAGKSSLLDALTFALFANAPRIGAGNLSNLISLGRKSFSVVLDFSVGGEVFRVTRLRRRSGSGADQLERVLVSGKTELSVSGAEAVTKEVERLLGLNFGHFTQAVFLPQGKFAEFLKHKPADRRRLLNELLRLMVYERMQECAGKEREAYSGRSAQIERRLREDFDGVTEDVRAELARSHQDRLDAVAEADARLPALIDAREAARHGRTWTAELEEKQAERATLQALAGRIDAARSELEAAARASGVAPLLDHADVAVKEDERRKTALQEACLKLDQSRTRHRASTADLERAATSAAGVPELRLRLTRLAATAAKLGLRDQLARQVHLHDDRLRAIEERQAQIAAVAKDAARRVAALRIESEQAAAELVAIGFEANHRSRLDAERTAAVRLQSDRAQLVRARERAEKDRASDLDAAASVERAVRETGRAEETLRLSRLAAGEASQALSQARMADAAGHLRSEIRLGVACPVCLREVGCIPPQDAAPELERLAQSLAAARAESASAEKSAAEAARVQAAAIATAEAARHRAAGSLVDLGRVETDVSSGEAALRTNVGDLISQSSEVAVEERVLTAARELTRREARYREAADRAAQLRTDLALRRGENESAVSEVARLEDERKLAASRLSADQEALDRVRAEIREEVGADEPGDESERVRQEIEVLEQVLATARASERETREELRLAESLAENRAEEAAAASARAAEARTRTAEALRDAGIADGAAVRAAVRTPQRMRAIQDQIAEHDGTARALDHRLAELEAALQGRRVTSESLREIEKAYEHCSQRRNAAETEAAVFDQRLVDLQERMEKAQQLRDERTELARKHKIYEWLARDLRNDRFQAYLLEEILTSLVREASRQLSALTEDRYGLTYEQDRISVIDFDNAGELRGVDTLSGGETFLASLSLALALSEQIQRVAGAVRLDCLFIDEGFGTLDPETLRTVSDAIRGLQVGGRMVGVITHVPELKEEFAQRLMVEKDSGSSRVRLEVV